MTWRSFGLRCQLGWRNAFRYTAIGPVGKRSIHRLLLATTPGEKPNLMPCGGHSWRGGHKSAGRGLHNRQAAIAASDEATQRKFGLPLLRVRERVRVSPCGLVVIARTAVGRWPAIGDAACRRRGCGGDHSTASSLPAAAFALIVYGPTFDARVLAPDFPSRVEIA
jgi:hypothetical protein